MAEPQTAAGAAMMLDQQRYYYTGVDWGYGYSRGIDRRYAEDILRRELQRLDQRLYDEEHYALRQQSDPYPEICYLRERYRRDKERLYQQFYTYNNERHYNTMDWSYRYFYPQPAYFTLTKENNMASKKFIVIGTSGAAAHPVEHTTQSDAESEATRLSKKTPGEEFVVFQTVKSFKVAAPEPVVKTYY